MWVSLLCFMKIVYLEKRGKEQFDEANLQSTIYNLQCRRMQAYACDKRSRNLTYCRPRLKARPATA